MSLKQIFDAVVSYQIPFGEIVEAIKAASPFIGGVFIIAGFVVILRAFILVRLDEKQKATKNRNSKPITKE